MGAVSALRLKVNYCFFRTGHKLLLLFKGRKKGRGGGEGGVKNSKGEKGGVVKGGCKGGIHR